MKKALLFLLTVSISASAQETGAHYLIITHDDFYNAALPLATWKYKKGMRSKIVKLSDIGSDSTAIRDYIVNAYDNWDIRPEYLLLIGAPNFLPLPMVEGGLSEVHTDNFYTNIHGDIRNEILSGRLTVHDTIEARAVVNKILTYERTPFLQDTLWFKQACLIVRCDYDPDDSIYWSALHYAADLMNAAGFVKIDLFSDSAGYNKDSIMNAVNEGRSIVMFRGSGFNNWPPPFDINPNLTENGAKLPVVLSITCQTVGTGSTPAIAERWLLTGTPDTARGASGYFASTTSINEGAHLRTAVANGFHEALFVQHKRTFGEACEGGRLRVLTMYPYHGGKKEYLCFITLGDPAMNLWTDTPCSLICTYPDTISIGSIGVTVNVVEAGSTAPVPDAVVCLVSLLDSTVYAVDTTDINGNAFLAVEPHFTGDTIHVTVTGHNLQPHEGRIITYVSGAYVAYLKSTIDDSANGNNDGLVSPSEEINLPLWVKNFGDSTAINVTGTLGCTDPYVTIVDSFKLFGNLLPDDSAFTGIDGYDFFIANNCPDRHNIDFCLTCRDINDSVWVSHFDIPVHAADIEYMDAAISGGNGNATIEPAETVTVAIILQNQGSICLDSTSAVLASSSPYISIIDSTGFFDHIGPDSIVSNNLDPFVLRADSGTPQGTYADFQVVLNSTYYTDTLSFSIVIGKKDYYVWNPDPTPISGNNIHTILTNLGYTGDYGATLAADLDPYNFIFICAGVFPHNYVIGSDSPEAQSLVAFVNEGGSICLEGGDVWFFDPLGNGFDFGELFGLSATDDGSNNLGPVNGQSSTFTDGMSFSYAGENNYIDHIEPSGANSLLIFEDSDDSYGCGVAYDATAYRTVGLSFELGLLTDSTPPSTRAALLDSIMTFFRNTPGVFEESVLSASRFMNLNVYPNPCMKQVNITLLFVNNHQPVTLKVYDILGRCVRTLLDKQRVHSTQQSIIWDGTDNRGMQLPEGVYFVKIQTVDYKKVSKVILLK
jgi:hypothetical protein